MTTECFVSVDIEADGPIPGDYSMLSMGASLVARPQGKFYAELRPICERFDPESLAVSNLDRDQLKLTGTDPFAAMRSLESWLVGACGGNQPIFIGNNAPFDWMFVCWYFWHFLGRNPFGYDALDIPSYAMGALDLTWEESGLKRLPQNLAMAGLSHNALADAVDQAEVFEKLRVWRSRHAAQVRTWATPRDVLDMD